MRTISITLLISASSLFAQQQLPTAVVLPTALHCSDDESIAEAVGFAQRQQGAANLAGARATLVMALRNAPGSALALDALGSAEEDEGHITDAERLYLGAFRAAEKEFSCSERISILHRIRILNNLGTLYLDTQQFAKGEWVRSQLKEMPADALDTYPRQAGQLLDVIGSLEHARKRSDEARRCYRQALVLLRRAEGLISEDAALVESNLAFLAFEAREYEVARGMFRGAIREIESSSGTEARALIRPLINLAQCEIATGNASEAKLRSRRAVELAVEIFGENHMETAELLKQEADVLMRVGQTTEAHRLRKRARAAEQNSLVNSSYSVDIRQLGKRQ